MAQGVAVGYGQQHGDRQEVFVRKPHTSIRNAVKLLFGSWPCRSVPSPER